MRKLISSFVAVVLLLLTTALNAQKIQFKSISPSIGFGSALKKIGENGKLPVIQVAFDFDVANKIRVSPFIGYTTSETKFLNSTIDYSSFLIGAKGKYELDDAKNYSLYLPFAIAINSTKASNSYGTISTDLDLAYSFGVGGSYNLAKSVSIFAELGYGISILNVGVTFNIKK
jgi:hypothetical protein